MKKVLLSVIAIISVIVLLPTAVLADQLHHPGELTVVRGLVKDTSGPVKGATVTVSCNGHTKTTHSGWNGKYDVHFTSSQCSDGNSVTVTAVTSKGLSGIGTGSVGEGHCDLDVALVNVTVGLPEMGALTGTMAALTAGGALFITRRRSLTQK